MYPKIRKWKSCLPLSKGNHRLIKTWRFQRKQQQICEWICLWELSEIQWQHQSAVFPKLKCLNAEWTLARTTTRCLLAASLEFCIVSRRSKSSLVSAAPTHSTQWERSSNILCTNCCHFAILKAARWKGKISSQTVDQSQKRVLCLYRSLTHTPTHTCRLSSPLETHQIAVRVVINLCHKPSTNMFLLNFLRKRWVLEHRRRGSHGGLRWTAFQRIRCFPFASPFYLANIRLNFLIVFSLHH